MTVTPFPQRYISGNSIQALVLCLEGLYLQQRCFAGMICLVAIQAIETENMFEAALAEMESA